MAYPTVNRSHIVPRMYLRNFADGELIAMRLVGEASSKVISVGDAAVRKAFYRRTRPDGTPIDDIEWSMSHLEGAVAPILREITDRWPLGVEDKSIVAQFCALQQVRAPAWMKWHEQFLQKQLDELGEGVPEYDTVLADVMTERTVARMGENLGSDTQRMIRMLSLISKVSAIFGSMHWALVRFHRPLLATSDHPVVVWPLTDGAREPAEPRLSDGVLPTLEVRLPVNPHLGLLMTWLDAEDPVEPIRGSREHAKNFNAFTIAQAEKQWFHLPGSKPPLVDGRLAPLSTQLVPGYGAAVAHQSRRRAEISRRVQPRIGTGPEDNQIEIVTVKEHQG